MGKKSIVKAIRYYEYQIERKVWLESIGVKSDKFIRKAFDNAFDKEFGKIFKSKIKPPF